MFFGLNDHGIVIYHGIFSIIGLLRTFAIIKEWDSCYILTMANDIINITYYKREDRVSNK